MNKKSSGKRQIHKSAVKILAALLCLAALVSGFPAAAYAQEEAVSPVMETDKAETELPDSSQSQTDEAETELPGSSRSQTDEAVTEPLVSSQPAWVSPEEHSLSVDEDSPSSSSSADEVSPSPAEASPFHAQQDLQEEASYPPPEEAVAFPEDEYFCGYRPVPGENEIESTAVLPEDDPRSITQFAASEDAAEETLPTKYITEKLPELKDQFYSSCWAHACMALAEINLMKKGLMDEPDLSELHTVWFSYHSVEDPLGGTAGDVNRVSAGTDIMSLGGNPVLAQNVLAGWTGAAAESVLESADASLVKNRVLTPEDSLAFLDTAHLTNIYEVDLKQDPEDAKRLIKDHGAIAASYYSASSTSAVTSGSTWNAATGAYYDKAHSGRQNHAIAIVGWDDAFSADNFITKPPRDGAWLVRNSWSVGSSEEGLKNPDYAGYFWMSYANASLAAGARAFDFAPADNYAHNYQYDGAMYRAGWNPGDGAKDELKAANIFTAKACENGEFLEAAAFQTASSNLEYTVEVYTELTDAADPESGTKVDGATVRGTTKYPGYYTVPLAEQVPVFPGQHYAIVVTLKKKGGSPTISREKSWYGWAIIETSIAEGQSFYEQNGWKDLSAEQGDLGNLAIKAFTDDIPEGTSFLPESVCLEEGLAKNGLTLRPGKEVQIRVSFIPKYIKTAPLVWGSSDETVAAVDADGLVRGISEGRAQITAALAEAPEISVSFTLTVSSSAFIPPNPIEEADLRSRLALAEDLSIAGEAEDGTLSDEQLREILNAVSETDENGLRKNLLWIAGLKQKERAYVYTGAAITPTIRIYDGIKLLRENQDYALRYANNKNAGQARIIVQFKGSYGSKKQELPFTIARAVLGTDLLADELAVKPKKNDALQKPAPVLRFADTGGQLKFNTADFTLVYSEDEQGNRTVPGVTDSGTYYAIVTAKEKKTQNYEGRLSVPIRVTENKTPLSLVSLKLNKSSFVYTGQEILPVLTLTDKTLRTVLQEGTDYTLEVKNNIEPGTANTILTGTGRYAGTRSVSFKITNGKRVENYPEDMRVEYEKSVPYAKSGAVPEVSVWDGGKRLEEGKDYTISCSGNKKNMTSAVLQVRFKGRYKGTIKKNFTVTKQNLAALRDGILADDVVLTGKADAWKKTAITIREEDGKKLSASDYEIVGFAICDTTTLQPGTRIQVTLKGKGNYEGEVTVKYTLISSPMRLVAAKQIKRLPDAVYGGGAVVLPEEAFAGILKTSAGAPLVPGVDFAVVCYLNNRSRGTGQVLLRGIPGKNGEGFGGIRTLSFTIKPREAALKTDIAR